MPELRSSNLSSAEYEPETREMVITFRSGASYAYSDVDQSTYDDLRYAQALASHQIPSGDVAEVFDRALQALVRELEKTRFAATTKPHPGRPRRAASPRHIPAEVKRTVWERDQGRCTFVSEAGQRCPARTRLEFDHLDPVARGGQATAARLRLRCRAHNLYEAERTFGAAFMREKREARRTAAATRVATKAAAAKARVEAAAVAVQDVIPWLRQLGFRADEARQAAALCESIPDAPLEERVRVALSWFHPRRPSHGLLRAAGGLGTAA